MKQALHNVEPEEHPRHTPEFYEDMLGILRLLDQHQLLHDISCEQFEVLDYQVPEQFKDWDKLAKYL